MWLVTARDSEMVSGRDSFTGSGMIDAFFDYWLPAFVHEMRYDYRRYTLNDDPETARKYANARYQEVVSKDGISVPDDRVGMEAYGEHSTAKDYTNIAKQQRKDDTQRATNFVMEAVSGGRCYDAIFGGAEVHAPSSSNKP